MHLGTSITPVGVWVPECLLLALRLALITAPALKYETQPATGIRSANQRLLMPVLLHIQPPLQRHIRMSHPRG